MNKNKNQCILLNSFLCLKRFITLIKLYHLNVTTEDIYIFFWSNIDIRTHLIEYFYNTFFKGFNQCQYALHKHTYRYICKIELYF